MSMFPGSNGGGNAGSTGGAGTSPQPFAAPSLSGSFHAPRSLFSGMGRSGIRPQPNPVRNVQPPQVTLAEPGAVGQMAAQAHQLNSQAKIAGMSDFAESVYRRFSQLFGPAVEARPGRQTTFGTGAAAADAKTAYDAYAASESGSGAAVTPSTGVEASVKVSEWVVAGAKSAQFNIGRGEKAAEEHRSGAATRASGAAAYTKGAATLANGAAASAPWNAVTPPLDPLQFVPAWPSKYAFVPAMPQSAPADPQMGAASTGISAPPAAPPQMTAAGAPPAPQTAPPPAAPMPAPAAPAAPGAADPAAAMQQQQQTMLPMGSGLAPQQADPMLGSPSAQSLLGAAQAPDSASEDMKYQGIVQASDNWMPPHERFHLQLGTALGQPTAIAGALLRSKRVSNSAIWKSAVDVDGSVTLDELLADLATKSAWQDNSKPSRSASTEGSSAGFAHKDDDYDRGPRAWENSGKYLKHGGGPDKRIRSSAGVKLAGLDLRSLLGKLRSRAAGAMSTMGAHPAETSAVAGGLLGAGLGAAGGAVLGDEENRGRNVLAGGALGAGIGAVGGGMLGRGRTTMTPPVGRGALMPVKQAALRTLVKRAMMNPGVAGKLRGFKARRTLAKYQPARDTMASGDSENDTKMAAMDAALLTVV